MSMVPQLLSHIHDLSDVSEAGAEIAIRPNAEQLARIAEWAGVNAVENFDANVTLHRRSMNRFTYDAEVNADIVQSCVVTLEPVRSHVALNVTRMLHLTNLPPRFAGEHELTPTSDESVEEIQDSRYDLGGPVLEEFALAIDPYPRCPGVEFETPLDDGASDSPFAALKSLKGGN